MPDLTSQQYDRIAGLGISDDDMGNAGYSGSSSGTAAMNEQVNNGAFANWISGRDPVGHNEALYAYQREQQAAKEAFEREANFNASEAQKNRDWQEMMSNTAFQRQVADLEKAGFSPLAALGGSSGAPVSSGSAASASGHQASSSAARGPSSNMGGVIGALVTAVALMATKGMSAVSKAAAASGTAAKAANETAANIRRSVLFDGMKDEIEQFAQSSSYNRFHGDITAWRKAGRP